MAAAAAAAAVTGDTPTVPVQNNVENLLDIDFDGTAPASAQKEPPSGMSGLEGLAGTPMRVQSPSVASPPAASNNFEDLMGVFGGPGETNPSSSQTGGLGTIGGNSPGADLMNGFASLDLAGRANTPSTAPPSGPSKNNDDSVDLI